MSRAFSSTVFPLGLRSRGWTAARVARVTAYLILKRTADVVGSLALLALLSPVMVVTYLVLLVSTRGRALYIQERLGKGGHPFPMIKFRTMVREAELLRSQVQNEQEGPIFKNRRDPRITPFGRFLRSTSIDEMPQLFNILCGHMSLVGPRPPLASEVAKYEPWQTVRLTVKPGLTCLWQVSGRSDLPFREWMRMDAWYVHNRSVWVDLWLLVRTPWSVLSRRGAY